MATKRPSRKPGHLHNRARAVIDEAIPALTEMCGGPPDIIDESLAAVFGSVAWQALGHDTTWKVFELVVRRLGESGNGAALDALASAIRQQWARHSERVSDRDLAARIRVFMNPAASERVVRDVVLLCRRGWRRA